MTLPIDSFRGIHSGRTFILGNGPSLGDHDLSKLQEPTFGVNRSFKAHASQYHVASDELTFREHRSDLRITPRHVFATEGRFPAEDADWVIPIKTLGDAIGWSWDLAKGVYPRFSTYVAMQLAVYMGFTDIVLLGTDLGSRRATTLGVTWQKGHFFSDGPLDNPFIGDARFQSECFGYAAAALAYSSPPCSVSVDILDIRVRVVSEQCPLRCFETVSFEEVVS